MKKTKTPLLFRQGDVLLMRVADRSVDGLAPKPRDGGRVVLAYGEVTGHAHAIDDAELFEEKDGVLYLRIGASGAALRHEEHGAIALEPGTYRVVRQREYHPDSIRPVAD